MHRFPAQEVLVKHLADICHSPTCQAEFRKYLKGIYGDLAALNRQWDTSYAKWDQVPIMNMKAARKHGNPSPWADHHMFKETVLAEAHNKCRSYIHEAAPGVTAGPSRARRRFRSPTSP